MAEDLLALNATSGKCAHDFALQALEITGGLVDSTDEWWLGPSPQDGKQKTILVYIYMFICLCIYIYIFHTSSQHQPVLMVMNKLAETVKLSQRNWGGKSRGQRELWISPPNRMD